MHNRAVFVASGIGLALAAVSALIFNEQPKAQGPLFSPTADPYAHGIYSEGMIESSQREGENINIYPEVPGPITAVLVGEGQKVRTGDPLLTIDDSVQRATTDQLRAQAAAALAMLSELKAEPRPETLAVSVAQVDNARATLKNARDQLDKEQRSYAMEPRSVSKNDLDNAINAERIAATNLEVVEKQLELTKAGAWIYDIENQERTYTALEQSYRSAAALLAKYTVRAPSDGVVLTVQATRGSYVSTQGAYDSYTQGYDPLIVMGTPQSQLEVRAYIDEILIHELPDTSQMQAEMFIRGTNQHVPLTFVRYQPYISPKIELSDERQELVDVRVLPVIFRLDNPAALHLYPGQLVDVYVRAR
ncbi:MAG TPA: biotin/lipoyl-binding protein [Steroidobacteraceae bacterium]|nr:biotin/lipoyl-binding protein [Steroidobacteraceae bacterium]